MPHWTSRAVQDDAGAYACMAAHRHRPPPADVDVLHIKRAHELSSTRGCGQNPRSVFQRWRHLLNKQACDQPHAEQLLCPAVVEDIRKKREAMSSQAGIYFITPTDSAVQRVLEDWDTRPQYKAAHIFFSSKVSGAQLQSIRNKPLLTQRLRSLKEVSSVADNA